MACIKLPVPSLPTLPTSFSFPSPPFPGVTIPDLCCQIHPEDYLPDAPPIQWPGTLNSATLAAINAVLIAAQTAVQDYVDSLVPQCPKT